MNRYIEHLLIVPEDDAIRQIVNGFIADIAISTNRVKVEPNAKGWSKARDSILSEYMPSLTRLQYRYLVVLIDLDDDSARLQQVRDQIPAECKDRMFVLGVASEAEDLRNKLNMTFEEVGRALAEDCRNSTSTVWTHELLSQNSEEIYRLRQSVSPFLFKDWPG